MPAPRLAISRYTHRCDTRQAVRKTDERAWSSGDASRGRSGACDDGDPFPPAVPAGDFAVRGRARAGDNSFIRANILSGFAELVQARGADPVAMLERAGIDPALLAAPDTLVSFRAYGALLEMTAEKTGRACLGLEWALDTPAHFPNSGPMLLLAGTTPTFGEWLGRMAAYWRLHTDALFPRVVDDGVGDIILRFDKKGALPARRQQMEHILGITVRIGRTVLANDKAAPVTVRFRHGRPHDTAIHEALFRCPLEFAANHDEIVLPRCVLELSLESHAAATEEITDAFIRHRIAMLPQYTPAVSTSTALAVKTVLGAGICSKEFISRALGASPRKLQRLLALEGATYEDVLDGVRRETACQLLAETAIPISTIAGMLDFASAAALTLAVRRWTGMTPSGYRASMQTQAE